MMLSSLLASNRQGLHAPKLRRANRAFCQVDIKDANNLAEEGQVWNVPIHNAAIRPGNAGVFKHHEPRFTWPFLQSDLPIAFYFFKCPETSLVISNMLTCFLPLNTACKFSSALIRVFFFASCKPFLRIS